MKIKKLVSLIMGLAFFILFANTGNAVAPVAGEEALFVSSTQPDALILLDLSDSMDLNPIGDDRPQSASCSSCTSASCQSHQCSRLDIAKRSIFSILDDNGDNVINTVDEGSLAVRLGYMRFYGCYANDTGEDYMNGCNTLIKAIGTRYSTINTSIQAERAAGSTPLAAALKEAKIYLDAHKDRDSAKNCRQKFVILITDGADNLACGANGTDCGPHRYKNRRETVAKAKLLRDAGYKVFVIGFGSTLPLYLSNTLNWMAYYGGTDNPDAANAGSTTGYSLPLAKDCASATPLEPANCCNRTDAACYPSGVTSCTNDASTLAATCSGTPQANFQASANDPGYLDLSGYAFLAADADQLMASLKAAINIIREATYSFSQASIQSSRTADENFVYEGSFQPINGDPFWFGHLRKYQINADGTVGSMLLDAGEVLKATAYTSRVGKVFTCIGCTSVTPASSAPTATYSLTGFSADIAKPYFDIATDAERDAIVGYVLGNPTYNPDNWKLGDVFRSTPITIGTPSAFFDDYRDAGNAFATHRASHERSSATGNRLIVAGANDGQFHAFKTSNMTEAWSFIPPNLLSKLKNVAHASEPTLLLHQYFVDGPVSGADVWLGSGSGTSKTSSDWKTILVFGEGRGSTDRLWSSSADCDSGLNAMYAPNATDATRNYVNYCGYYALDLNDSLNPKYMWRLNGFNATTQAPYMGESWSKMVMGRILVKSGSTETEKWVGFVGGGYNANACPNTGNCDDKRGKGFFVVDLANGQILWSFSHGATSSTTRSSAMRYSLPAPPSIVDTDNDGFIDTAYLGDLGGNMWRFKLCSAAQLKAGSCTTSNWSGGLFFDSSTGSIRPIHTGAAVSRDGIGNIWVFWGTGDKVDPTASNAQEHFYGVKDNLTSTYRVGDIDNITQETGVFDPASSNVGYRIQMPGQGVKILAEPAVFGGVAYFTTFTPGQTSDPCDQAGDATLFGVNFTTGAGVFGGTTPRKMDIGSGIASAPIVSLKPSGTGGAAADLYVTVSGGGASAASTQKINFDPPGVSNRTNMLYWKDRRIE